MANKTSQHILSTAANLLGFCLIIVTSLHLTNKTESSILDEGASIIALLLTISTFLSFLSLRADAPQREARLEQIADYLFGISIIGILGLVVAIMFLFWLKYCVAIAPRHCRFRIAGHRDSVPNFATCIWDSPSLKFQESKDDAKNYAFSMV
jgi:hypothetical protein